MNYNRVVPRGHSTDYVAHVLNQSTQSDVTSWTYDKAIARRFGDLVLEIDADYVRDQIIDPHPLPLRFPTEKEVLVQGPISNVKVTS